jgi:ABC-type antimicrobial peptide transport system permease subunit
VRTREFGVRTALGASPARLLRGLIGESVALAAIASGLGLPLAAGAGGLMSSLLFGVSARDPWPYALVAAVAMTVVLAASLPPARRVLRIAPTEALRDVG